MFSSFFPRPKLLFSSAAIWTLVAVLLWYLAGGSGWGAAIGLPPMAEGQEPPIGLSFFITPDFLWFYLYFAIFAGSFGLTWQIIAKEQEWRTWSIWGSILMVFVTYYGVQVSVLINNWQGPFFNMVQKALEKPGNVSEGEFYAQFFTFMVIALMAVVVFVLTRFFSSHFLFRWRAAMTKHYLAQWPKIRRIEGSSQRIQEDTSRFANIVEDLGVSIVDAVMTLIAFLPILMHYSDKIKVLPVIGEVPGSLVIAAIFWSVFGTALMYFVGIKLPGLYFHQQRVEASFRKELVLGEDHAHRADPLTVSELFDNVRKNAFTIYFHYVYFNIFRRIYGQLDVIFGYFLLVPSMATAAITFGLMNQALGAFGNVTNSFQLLYNSWPTIIELLSIQKRLKAFDASIKGLELAPIETEAADELTPVADAVVPGTVSNPDSPPSSAP